MADEKINVLIKFDSNTRKLKETITHLSALKKLDNRFSSGRNLEAYAKSSAQSLAAVTKAWKRSFDFIDAGVKMTGKLLSGFLRFAIKGVILEMAALGATMVGVHAVFVAGQYIMKAYRGVMQMLAQGAAAATVGIAAMSAAIREQQAAMFAYRGKGAKEFGSGMQQTRMAMRNLQMDASLATLGVENLNKAYGTMSKTMNVVQINQSTNAIKALMDFGSAGQDPAKGLEQVAIVVESLSNKKKNISDVITEAKKLGPEMEKALKDANVKTKKDFEKLLFSGDLAKKGGVSGQFDAVNSTLIGQLKSYMGMVRGLFADFGDQFLEPLKVSFQKVFNIVQRDISRILGTVQYTVGADGYFDGMVDAIDKASNWMVKMIREYLPAAQGMFGRMGDWFENFRRGWNLILDQLRPLIDGARILYKAWDPIWEAIKRGADNLWIFRSLLIDNQNDMEEFGERIGTFIDKFSEFMTGLKKMFADMAPFINDMVTGITQVFQMLSKLMTGMAGGGFASALAPLMAFNIIGKQMQGVKGRFMPQASTKNMQVNAANVQINGPAGPVSGLTNIGSGDSGISAAGGVLSSGAAGGAGGATVAGMAGAALEFKTSGGGIASGATPTPGTPGAGLPAIPPAGQIRQMHLTPEFRTMRMRDLIGFGRDKMTEGSNFSARNLERIAKRDAVGPSFGGIIFDRAMRKMSSGSGDESDAGPTLREGARNSLKRAGLTSRNALDRAQYGARRATGRYMGAIEFMRGGAIDEKTGEPIDIASKRAAIDARYSRVDADGNPTGPPRGPFGRTMDRMGRARDMNRLYRNESRFGNAYNNRFSKSLGGRMGVGMGLGIGSQYAPEEMRGAMALGGMAAQIDPRLGLAVAGVGGAMSARGAGAGALSGAAGGAAIGAMFGPQAAIAGALIGGVFGAIKGRINKAKYEMQEAKAAAESGLSTLYSGITAAASGAFLKNQQRVESGESFSPNERGTLEGLGGRLVEAKNPLREFLERSSVAEYDKIKKTGMYKGKKLTPEELASRLRVESGETVVTFLDEKDLGDGRGTRKSNFYDEGGYSQKDMAKFITSNPSRFGMEFTEAQKKQAETDPQTFLKTLRGTVETDRQLGVLDKVNSERIKALSIVTNKSGAELEVMAQNLGIDLYDATVNYNELLGKFTKNLLMNKDQLNAAMTDVFLAGASPYRKEREAKEAENSLNAIGKKMQDIHTGGGSKAQKMGDINAQMEQLFPAILASAGGDGIKAIQAYRQMFVEGKAFGKGEQLQGMGGYFDENNEAFNESNKKILSGFSGNIGTQIRGRLATRNIGADQGLLENAINNLKGEELDRFLADVEKLDENTTSATGRGETNKLKQILNMENPAEIGKALAKEYKLTGVSFTQTSDEVLNSIADMSVEQKEATAGLNAAIKIFNDNAAKFTSQVLGGEQGPGWWQKGLKITGEGTDQIRLAPGDTSTPRGGAVGDTTTSKLSQTMGRHADMDGRLTGKRTVTSSLRNYALGSPSSDHATGAAYDLTGQNLGMYARLVHNNGGFAEFHGSMANRHLHVVPGSGPVGDTSSMRKTSVSSSGGGSTVTNYYTFEISGGDPESIANRVMEKIKSQERSARERG
jgi:hypothetical protein